MVQATCLQCSTVFPRRRDQVAKYARSFCGRKCKGSYQAAHTTECGIGPKLRVEHPCATCGKKVARVPSQTLSRVFCSRQCASETLIPGGESHPKWKGGISPYAPEYNKWKRYSIRKRDGFRCATCKSAGTARHRLEVHHRDQDKSHNEDSNLITLCKACHDRVHRGSLCLFPR